MTKQELLRLVQKLPANEVFAVRVWTRDDVAEAHKELIECYEVYPQPFSDSESDEILRKFESGSEQQHQTKEMSWSNLKAVIREYSADRDDLEIGIGRR